MLRGEIYLAKKYLRPQRSLISVLTYLSFLGPVLGVSILIFVSAIMNGFPKKVIDNIKNSTPSITIKKKSGLFIYKKEIKKIKKDFGLNANATGQIQSFLQPENNQNQIYGILLKGFYPPTDKSPLENFIVSGTHKINDKEIIIGIDFAQEKGLNIGDKVFVHAPHRYTKMIKKLNSPNAQQNDNITLDLAKQLTIAGIFDFNYSKYDSFYTFIHLDTFNDLNDLKWSRAPRLEIWLDQPENAENIINNFMNHPYWKNFNYSFWKESNRGFVQLVENEKFMIFFALSFVMLAATLGIAVSILSFILKKLREIGILKSLGISSKSITLLFFIQGSFLGALSSTIGLGLGLLMIKYRQALLNTFEFIVGRELLPKHTYQINALPAYINQTEILVIYTGCVFLCVITSIIPSLIASKVKPHKVLQTGV